MINLSFWQKILIILGILIFISSCLGVLWSSYQLVEGDYAQEIRKFSIFCLIAGSLVIAFQLAKLFF